MATFKVQPLNSPQQPRLPAAPVEYNQKYGDDLTNILRLYFNQIQNFNQLLTADVGGALIRFPNGIFNQNSSTKLSNTLTSVATTALVVSTEGFPSSGYLIVENEIINYTGTTSTTFTGLTRAQYGTTASSHSTNKDVSLAFGVFSASTAQAISFNATVSSNTVSINAGDPTLVDFQYPAYYDIQLSVQFFNFTATDDTITVWLKVNGTNVENTAFTSIVPSAIASGPGSMIVARSSVLAINQNDQLEVYFSSRTGNTVVATYPSQITPDRPKAPAAVLNASFVSALFLQV